MVSMKALVPASVMLIASTFGCQKREPQEVQSLRWLDIANPITDAKAALSKGDHTLRAVYGLSVSIPGTERKDFELLKQIYGITEIAGTSDSLVNDEHGRLVLLAIKYSETYNRYIINEYKTKPSS